MEDVEGNDSKTRGPDRQDAGELAGELRRWEENHTLHLKLAIFTVKESHLVQGKVCLVSGVLQMLERPSVLPLPHIEHGLHKPPELLQTLSPLSSASSEAPQSSGVQQQVVEVRLCGPVSLG